MANSLARFNPFGDLAHLDALRDFDDLFRRFPLGSALNDAAVAPRLNLEVSENEGAYAVKVEAPGVKKEDVKVTIDGNVVSIRVETKREGEQKQGDTILRSERYYGVQSRSFSLANDIDSAKSTARYQDGVLELVLPKKTVEGGARTLEIA